MKKIREATRPKPMKIKAETNPAISGEEEYLDKKELARRLLSTPRCVDGLVRRRAIPVIKRGRFVRFKWSAVEAALARYEIREVGRQ